MNCEICNKRAPNHERWCPARPTHGDVLGVDRRTPGSHRRPNLAELDNDQDLPELKERDE